MKLILLLYGVSVVFGDNSTGVGIAQYDEEKEPSVNTRRKISGALQGRDNRIDTDFDPSGPRENRIVKDCARVYEHFNYQGDSYLVRGENNDLRNIGWNDRISSVKIFSGCRLFQYEHTNFNGWRLYNPIISPNTIVGWMDFIIGGEDWNDRVSSLECDCRKVCAQFYTHENYRGKSYMIQQGSHNNDLRNIGWNDIISSIRIMAGCRLKVYEHVNYQGPYYYNPFYRTYNIGWRNLVWNDKISSWKCDCQ